jgi:hypothetical protein
VAAGDLDGDGRAELVFGAGPGGAPRVIVLDGATVAARQIDRAEGDPLATFFVGGDATSRGGVSVAVSDLDGDGRAELYAHNRAKGDTRAYRDPADLSAAGTGDDPLGLLAVGPFVG